MKTKGHILVIEDDDVLRESLLYALDKEGYTVKGVPTGEKALEMADKELFDLIISDVRLPGKIDGIDAVDQIKKMYSHVRTMVIVVTGYADKDANSRAIKAGVNEYIRKPFDLNTFLDQVSHYMQEATKKRRKLLKVAYRLTRFLFNKYKSITATFIKIRYRVMRRFRFRYTRWFMFLGAKLWLRKIHHPENLPSKGPAIIVSNHLSYFDWMLLSVIYDKKYITFVGKEELLRRRSTNWMMNFNILIFINPDKPGFSYFKQLLSRLRQNQIVVIYPEGTRSKTGKMLDPKVGFVTLALKLGVPIVPVGMKGTFDILPPNKKFPRFKKCDIHVGKPIVVNKDNPLFHDVYQTEKSSQKMSDEGLKIISIRIMNEIAKMVDQEWSMDVGRYLKK